MESPPQLPASKASPPTSKRIPSSPVIKKSPNTAPQPQANNTKATNPSNAKSINPVVPVQTADSSLDNQPIPKLITTNESVHYSYATSYGAIYQQQYHGVATGQMQTAMHQTVVPNMYPAQNQYAQSAMPPTIQAAPMQQFQQSNPAAAYYQPPPPPSATRNYYHGPT